LFYKERTKLHNETYTGKAATGVFIFKFCVGCHFRHSNNSFPNVDITEASLDRVKGDLHCKYSTMKKAYFFTILSGQAVPPFTQNSGLNLKLLPAEARVDL
jgi:hypothetical protein